MKVVHLLYVILVTGNFGLDNACKTDSGDQDQAFLANGYLEDICGTQWGTPNERYKGRVPLRDELFPWDVFIQWREHGVKCGGTLIDLDVVVTAATCVPQPYNTPGAVQLVKKDAVKILTGRKSTNAATRNDYRTASAVFVHESFTINEKKHARHNIALLYFNIPIVVSEKVRPVCRSTGLRPFKSIVTGWSPPITDSPQTTGEIISTYLWVYLETDKCADEFGSAVRDYEETMCVAPRAAEEASILATDMGSALIHSHDHGVHWLNTRPGNPSKWLIYGVVSMTSENSQQPGKPAIVTRFAHYEVKAEKYRGQSWIDFGIKQLRAAEN